MRRILSIYFLFLFVSPAYAQKLATLSTESLEFTLQQDGNEFKLYIKPIKDLGEQSLTANVFPVKNPSRLVLDVPDPSKGSQKSIQFNNEFISAMRLGAHNNKSRLVIDIKNEGVPAYDISADQENGRLVASFTISVNKNAKIEKEVAPIIEATAKPTPKPTIKVIEEVLEEEIPPTIKPTAVIATEDFQESGSISIKPTPVADIGTEKVETDNKKEIFVLKGNQEVNEPITKEIPSKTTSSNPAVGKGSLIKNILFQAPKDAPLGAIVIEGDNLGEYKIDQKGKNLYEMTLPNSKLSGDHLSLPQFPPATFKGFEVILANQDGNDVLLKIYVNPGIKIKSFNAKGKLWLKAEN